ncbi:hypothetical protein V8G54_011331 [Vigna mungo]|uniref:Pectinesterase n=1 Tax=Vigna mungo TaxID=3915 RepID=A0AAQ3NR61_VIGMU
MRKREKGKTGTVDEHWAICDGWMKKDISKNRRPMGPGKEQRNQRHHYHYRNQKRACWFQYLGHCNFVESAHFLASNITFQNTARPSNHQAVALAVTGTFSAFYNCEVLEYQDTLYVMQGVYFFVKCLIEGTVDFIFGDTAQVALQDCDIQVRIPLPGQPNVITAQGRRTNNDEGEIVIQSCRIGATHDFEGVKKNFKTYLGKPWKNYSKTIIMKSYMSDIIDPTGWIEWEVTTLGLNTLFYREYNNIGSGAQTSKRVTWKRFKVITHAVEVEPFTARNFINDSQWISGFFAGTIARRRTRKMEVARLTAELLEDGHGRFSIAMKMVRAQFWWRFMKDNGDARSLMARWVRFCPVVVEVVGEEEEERGGS